MWVGAEVATGAAADYFQELNVDSSVSLFEGNWVEQTAGCNKNATIYSAKQPAQRKLGCGAERAPKGGPDGLIVFDQKGRLVKADARAATILAQIGVELNCHPRLRIEALDAADAKADELDLPDWLDPDWIEPIMEDGERLGTVVMVPERVSSPASPPQSGLPVYKLRRVADFIHARIDQPIHLEQLAAAVALSPFHFHREFKRSTGMTPHQYIVHVRMERAKSLLSGSDMPLAEVAVHVGFADQSHFTATFRKTTSMTPRSYRNATCTV